MPFPQGQISNDHDYLMPATRPGSRLWYAVSMAAARERRFGFMVPGAILGLMLIAHIAPFTGNRKSAAIWLIAVILGAFVGAGVDAIMAIAKSACHKSSDN